LFLGPTGVGKTELSKALAQSVFGDESSIIRVDMSEYMEKHSVSKMIGSPPGYVGYEEGGQLSEKVRKNPYSLILFDEIEKAHPDVFHILLQVLDEGHVTDSQGRKVDFKNTIIIMTSNAGAKNIMNPKSLGFATSENEGVNYEKMKEKVMEEVKFTFKPEFINRIDDIIVFHVLKKEEIYQIAKLQLEELSKRAKKQLELTLNYEESVYEYIMKKGYDEKYGARPVKRVIQSKIEDSLAEEILKGNFTQGDRITVFEKEDKIVFSKVQ
jgi:ATP-dependent Clp protease ATP-binding subunit ClpC